VHRLAWGNVGLVMPTGMLAETGEGKPGFRVAPAQQLKKRGVRLVGGWVVGVERRLNDRQLAVCRFFLVQRP
jgi:hypothetical protein